MAGNLPGTDPAGFPRFDHARSPDGSVVRRLREQGHESILLWSFTDNPNITFYENLGGTVVSHKELDVTGTVLKETAFGWKDLAVFDEILKTND